MTQAIVLVVGEHRGWRAIAHLHADDQRGWDATDQVEVVGTAKRIVAESDLVGGALLTQIEGEIEVGALAVLRYYADWMRLNYGFIYLRNRTVSPAARAFMAEFRRLDAELEAREIALQRRYKVGPAAKRSAARRS